jgi:hypothetical protein
VLLKQIHQLLIVFYLLAEGNRKKYGDYDLAFSLITIGFLFGLKKFAINLCLGTTLSG